MTGQEIRKVFLKFFEDRGHKILPSSSLVPSEGGVLLTLAGMLQFKPIFLGLEKPVYKRVATVQKCVRMNDIEKVGKTSRHHTFFEMLGNFSFGDYFKKEAIAWAWELLTKVFDLEANKLLVAVYEKDEEAANIWREEIGLKENRIFKLGEDNNFWAAGETGPCGPCSEIYYDLGPERGCRKAGCIPGCDCDRYLELWNLVFIEFNKDEEGKLHRLPNKNIDTGMGLERIAAVLQGVPTNFDTDLIKPIVDKIEFLSGPSPLNVESIRIIADHIRAITYLLGDGVIPSNEGRGYVLRRLIRRGIRHGRLLGIEEAFLYKISGEVIKIALPAYPDLAKKESYIQKTIKMEEDHFRKTLEIGMELLLKIIEAHRADKIIPGKDVFILHDTYGFPLELTKEIAAEASLAVDEKGFVEEMEKQKERARLFGLSPEDIRMRIQKLGLSKFGPTKFVGYDTLQSDSKILAIETGENLIVLDKTPFYPESGGQVSDGGSLEVNHREIKVKGAFGELGGVIAHKISDVSPFRVGMTVKATVDSGGRFQTANHHTATHLLHAALREVLGNHVRQSGSLVSPTHLRFDFNHFGPLKDEEIEKIERLINDKIRENIKIETFETSFTEATKMGAVALFGEKYGEKVRVVKIGNFSLELCGGTHVKSTGIIEMFKIKSETAIAGGLRRIEALAGSPVIEYIMGEVEENRRKNIELLGRCKQLEFEKERLGGAPLLDFDIFEITPEEINTIKRVLRSKDLSATSKFLEHLKERNGRLSDRIENLEKENKRLTLKKAEGEADFLIAKKIDVGETAVVCAELKDYGVEVLRILADRIKEKLKSCIVILASAIQGKAMLVVALTEDLTKKGFDARTIVKEAATKIGGYGGGKSSLAEAGGRNISKISEALAAAVEVIRKSAS